MLRGTAALLVLLLQLSCSDGTEASPVPATVQLSASTLSVADGESSRLIATVLDQSGAPLTSLPSGVTIDWSSSDPSIASVTGGYVTGNRPGSAEITVSVGTASASASVTVTQVARSLERVLGDGQSGVAGEKLSDSLKVRVIDRHGDGVAGIAVAWEVSTGDGGLEGVTTTSNSHGHARASWRLGGIGGTQIVIARLTQTGGATMFSATAVGGPGAPFIVAVSPAVLVPGETATITGGNFDLDVANLKVSVAGMPVTVLSVAAEQLTVQMPARTLLPCNPVGDTSIGVTSRGFTAIEQHPLKAAIDRNLVVGESLILQGAADLACNGLPAGRYMLSTFYTSRSVGATATVELRGSAGPGASFSTGAGTATAVVGTNARGPLRETTGAD
ncbi:MAG: IPT/TIG domain-containing protein, partial [Gemmatimonadetes bacterium]|nr:IPT/TIG domain-containing protein [Gemmatimonadota bacterium]